MAASLRALERPDWVFWCYLPSSIVAVTIGIPLAATMGVSGAMGGLLLYYTVTGLSLFFFYKWFLHRQAWGNA